MRTLIMILTLVVTMSFSGMASATKAPAVNQTEKVTASKTASGAKPKSGKSKHTRAKKHHQTSTRKKKK